jgi:hypothetical protein
MSQPEDGAQPDTLPVVRDRLYYASVRRAVGRGAPSVLFGTSGRSLDRALQEIRASRAEEFRTLHRLAAWREYREYPVWFLLGADPPSDLSSFRITGERTHLLLRKVLGSVIFYAGLAGSIAIAVLTYFDVASKGLLSPSRVGIWAASACLVVGYALRADWDGPISRALASMRRRLQQPLHRHHPEQGPAHERGE